LEQLRRDPSLCSAYVRGWEDRTADVHRSLRAFQPSSTRPSAADRPTEDHGTSDSGQHCRSTTADTPTDTFNTSNTSQFCNRYFDCAHLLYYTYKIHRRNVSPRTFVVLIFFFCTIYFYLYTCSLYLAVTLCTRYPHLNKPNN